MRDLIHKKVCDAIKIVSVVVCNTLEYVILTVKWKIYGDSDFPFQEIWRPRSVSKSEKEQHLSN